MSSQEEETCEDGHYCDDTENAECAEGICAPDEPACDNNRAAVCNEIGDAFLPGGTDCGSDASCDQGKCEAHVCTPGAMFCQGRAVRECAQNGLSSAVVETCQGELGVCAQTGGSAACVECVDEQTRCSVHGLQTCDSSGSWGEEVACGPATPFCDPSQGACSATPPSCQGLADTCGPTENQSCCTSLSVTGGSYSFGFTGHLLATVTGFRLDKYEVTVGRFRKFLAAWSGGYRPAAGAGKHTHLHNGSGLANPYDPEKNESGWDTAWASNVSTSHSVRAGGTWTATAGANENLPMNYVSWFEAAAFCIWDGGFLPSNVEWEYVAIGDRTYFPWGNQTVTTPTWVDAGASPWWAAGRPKVTASGDRVT